MTHSEAGRSTREFKGPDEVYAYFESLHGTRVKVPFGIIIISDLSKIGAEVDKNTIRLELASGNGLNEVYFIDPKLGVRSHIFTPPPQINETVLGERVETKGLSRENPLVKSRGDSDTEKEENVRRAKELAQFVENALQTSTSGS